MNDYILLLGFIIGFICLLISFMIGSGIFLIIGGFSFWLILLINKIMEYIENKNYKIFIKK